MKISIQLDSTQTMVRVVYSAASLFVLFAVLGGVIGHKRKSLMRRAGDSIENSIENSEDVGTGSLSRTEAQMVAGALKGWREFWRE